MDECQNSDTNNNSSNNALGFCLLPLELIQSILFSLALPEIIRMKQVNKFLACLISDQNFIRECNLRSRTATWLFVHNKRWRRDAVIHGFSDHSDRWFKVSIGDLMKQVIFYPGEDIHLLTASGNIFLFASNSQKAVIAVNLVTRAVKRIPPCPLGPRGTSSWRRSGMKLVPDPFDSGHFRFLFVELVENHPFLFEYNSETDKWQSTEERDMQYGKLPGNDCMFLNALNGPCGSVVVAVGSESTKSPLILRPRLKDRGQQSSTASSSVPINKCKHMYGDGHLMIIRSDGIDNDNNNRFRRMKMFSIEIWGINVNSGNWENVSNVPSDIMERIGKPYGVMIGCLEAKDEIIKAVLMSKFEGSWDINWLTYDRKKGFWNWVPLPDCKRTDSNLAGITFASGFSLT